jgi:hypothetical protein
VNENLDGGVLPHKRAGHAGVVEMDVGQEHLTHVRYRDSLAAKGVRQVLVRR